MRNRFVATAMAALLANIPVLAQEPQTAPPTGQISGTAKDEAKAPYNDYTVRVREVKQGTIAGTATLDATGAFIIPNLPTDNFVVELVNKDGEMVCQEGPYNLYGQLIKDGVVIDCNKIPAVWWLLAGAAAAGVTAGIVTTGQASPSR